MRSHNHALSSARILMLANYLLYCCGEYLF
jgi:hypothetical protein